VAVQLVLVLTPKQAQQRRRKVAHCPRLLHSHLVQLLLSVALAGLALLMVVAVAVWVLLARVMAVGAVVVGAVAVPGTPVLGVGTAETGSRIPLLKLRQKKLTLRVRKLASILMPMKTSLLRPAATMYPHQSTHLQRLIWVMR